MSGLIFYMHDGPNTFRFELAGTLAGADVAKLEQAWRTASSTVDEKVLALDVTFLNSTDEKGRDLLFRWWRAGGRFVANSPQSRNLVEWITGLPYVMPDRSVGPTFDPRFPSWKSGLVALFCAAALLFPAKVRAAEMAPQSVAILERYDAALLAPGGLDRFPASVEVDASMPKLEKQARVEAVRSLSKGRRKYRFVSSTGDSFVRNEMIARYFSMEAQVSPLAAPITKSNYRFRFVTINETGTTPAYVFKITPRRKRQGMIEGELWIDPVTGLVTHLAGRLVKNPSILLRHVQISQEMEICDGSVCSRETHLRMDTRFAGRAELTIREKPLSAVADAEGIENVTP